MKKLLFLTIAMQITLFAQTYITINPEDVVEDHVDYLEKKYYRVEVEKTQTATIKLTNLKADLDLYIALNRIAKIRNNDCYSSNGGTTNEICVLTSTAPKGKTNDIIIMVYGFKASTYKLEVSTKEGAEEIRNISDTPLSAYVKRGESERYKFSGKKGETYTTTLSALTADADLRVKVGKKAGLHSFDCKSTNGGTKTDKCSVTLTKDATIFVHVNGYKAADYQIAVSKSTTNASLTLAKLKEMIANNEDVTQVDTSAITDMSNLFKQNKEFNQDISAWDVSNVTNMSGMFYQAYAFNQPIGNWNVSNVTNMENMFHSATNFDQPIGDWDVSNVTNMKGLFSRGMTSPTNFNQPLENWNVSNVTNMENMFSHAGKFNQPIGNWNVSKVSNMHNMFINDKVFNQPLENWNVSNVTNMEDMFNHAAKFNQPIGNWNVSKVRNMNRMFNHNEVFNQPLENWDVSNVTGMDSMFLAAKSFNQPLGSWDVSNVTNMYGMFNSAENFNQDIGSWNVSNLQNIMGMLYGTKFNQDISDWDISKLSFSGYGKIADISLPSTFSTQNYDKLLMSWSKLNLQKGLYFEAKSVKYTNQASQAREILINNFNWHINDAGKK